MQDLTTHDTNALLDGVAVLAETLSLEGVRQQSVNTVHRLVPGLSATWNEISTEGIEVVGVPAIEAWPGGEEAFARVIVDHPVIAYTQRTNDGRPRAISDLWTVEQFHASALYRDFYAHTQTEDQLSFIIPSPHILIGVAINRDSVGFSRRDRNMANLLRPHILQAYRNAVAAEHIEILVEMLEALASDHNEGLVMLRNIDQTEHLSPSAITLLTKWFPGDAKGRLPELLSEWVRTQRTDPMPAPTWPLVFERSARRLVVRRLQSVKDAEAGREVLLVSEVSAGPGREELRSLGLSTRQSEVVTLAAEGRSNREIAEKLEISVRTVEGHLSQAFDRLGVRSRTAAANLIHQMELRGQ